MGCKICRTKPVIKLTSTKISLCDKCFLRYFESKYLRTIRTYNMIKNTKKLYIFNDKYSEINYFILKRLSDERKGKFKVLKTNNKKLNIINSNNLDKISSLILLSEFKNKFKKDLTPIYKNKLSPLYFLNNKEIDLYAKLNKLKTKKEKIDKNEEKILKFLDEVESKYEGTRNNIVKSYLELIQ